MLNFGRLHDNGYFVIVGINQCLTTLETGNGLNLGLGQLQNILYILGFIRLKVEDDFVLGVIDNGTTVFAILKSEEVAEVLCSRDGCTTETTNGFENCQAELCSLLIGTGTDKLPYLVDHNRLLLGKVFLDRVPNIIEGNHHTNGKKLSFKL